MKLIDKDKLLEAMQGGFFKIVDDYNLAMEIVEQAPVVSESEVKQMLLGLELDK